jgi:hypothetical protein
MITSHNDFCLGCRIESPRNEQWRCAQTYAQNAIDVAGFRIRTAASWALCPVKGELGDEKNQ